MKEPVPEDVIWVPGNHAFYRGTNPKEGQYNGLTFMGQDFLRKWWPRRKEFLQDASPRVLQ